MRARARACMRICMLYWLTNFEFYHLNVKARVLINHLIDTKRFVDEYMLYVPPARTYTHTHTHTHTYFFLLLLKQTCNYIIMYELETVTPNAMDTRPNFLPNECAISSVCFMWLGVRVRVRVRVRG